MGIVFDIVTVTNKLEKKIIKIDFLQTPKLYDKSIKTYIS